MTSFSNASLSESLSTCVIPVQSAQMVGSAAIIHLFVAITVKPIARIWSKSARLLACPAIATRPVAQINADMVRTQSLQDNARTKINECGWDLGLSVS